VHLFVQKAAIQEAESVLDLGSGTSGTAAEGHRYAMGNIVGVDISTKMVAESRQLAKDQGLPIACLAGNFITMQRLATIKPPGGFDVITCLWPFSNVTPDLRGAMLRTWMNFLTPQGRIVFEMHHPIYHLTNNDVKNEGGMLVFCWKMLDQHSLATCTVAC
jgi:ubiquinone/menaquinone biosynthesis C-methylase UbiE